MASNDVADDTDKFKAAFKKYKKRNQKLDLSTVVDVDKTTDSNTIVQIKPSVPHLKQICGLRPLVQWKIYHFLQHKGFYLIRNPFLLGYQHYWVSRCLADLPLPPNVTNLRVHPDLNPQSLWTDFVSHREIGKPLDSSSPLRKLRWTTLGYHYNWDTKKYNEEDYTPFPEDLGIFAKYVSEVMGFSNFQAEAGIINYYHLDSTLAGHTDHSELDHEAPLISISFGQAAIFLLGGQTKAVEPTPVLLHSGDICIMSGSSRLAYHAVPCILCPTHLGPPPCLDICRENKGVPHPYTSGEMFSKEKIGREENGAMPSRHKVESKGDNEITTENKKESQGDSESFSDESFGGLWNANRNKKDLYGCNCSFSIEHDDKQKCSTCICENLKSFTDSDSEKKKLTDKTSPYTITKQILQDSSFINSIQRETFTKSHDHSSSFLDSVLLEAQELQDKASANLVKEVNARIIQTLQNLVWEPFAAYLSFSRLNLNIRQVLKPGQTFQNTLPQETDLGKTKNFSA